MDEHPLGAALLAQAAWSAVLAGRLDDAADYEARRVASEAALGLPLNPANFQAPATIALFSGDIVAAGEHARRWIAVARDAGDHYQAVQGLTIALGRADRRLPEALRSIEEAVVEARRLGNPSNLSWAISVFGLFLSDTPIRSARSTCARKPWHWAPPSGTSKASHRRSARLAWARGTARRPPRGASSADRGGRSSSSRSVTTSKSLPRCSWSPSPSPNSRRTRLRDPPRRGRRDQRRPGLVRTAGGGSRPGDRGMHRRPRGRRASPSCANRARRCRTKRRSRSRAKPWSSYSSSSRNLASSMTSTPSCSALASFVPGLSPAST